MPGSVLSLERAGRQGTQGTFRRPQRWFRLRNVIFVFIYVFILYIFIYFHVYIYWLFWVWAWKCLYTGVHLPIWVVLWASAFTGIICCPPARFAQLRRAVLRSPNAATRRDFCICTDICTPACSEHLQPAPGWVVERDLPAEGPNAGPYNLPPPASSVSPGE